MVPPDEQATMILEFLFSFDSTPIYDHKSIKDVIVIVVN